MILTSVVEYEGRVAKTRAIINSQSCVHAINHGSCREHLNLKSWGLGNRGSAKSYALVLLHRAVHSRP